ncbi:hypothetical protein, partial [uncultured Treponema sp.]|uniref:hypothetical protein n=1 Tax=uncultured Treponema sp. TaxID=162155 RepID=UPI0026244990
NRHQRQKGIHQAVWKITGSISSSVNLLSLPCLTPLYLHSKLAEAVIIGLDPIISDFRFFRPEC